MMSKNGCYEDKKIQKTKVLRIAGLIVVAALLSLSMTSCVDQSQGRKDDKHQKAKLVATSPSSAEICSRLDLDLVGVCKTSRTLPKRYKDVKKVGLPMNPDPEIIKSLNPDYIISPKTLEKDLKPKYKAIDKKAIFLDLKSVDGMYRSINDLGERFGREKEAEKLQKEYKDFLEKYRKKNKGKKQPKVLVLMGLPGSYIVATENSYVGSLVKVAGGENVFQGSEEEFLTVNTEELKTKEPDVILRAAHAMPDDVKKMFADEFKKNQIWKHFDAVKNDRVYDLDPEFFGMSASFSYPEALKELQPMLYK